MQPIIYILRNSADNALLNKLHHWSKNRSDTGGVLQVVSDGKLFFEDVITGEQRAVEAEKKEKWAFEAGEQRLSAIAYEWAGDKLTEAFENPKIKWLLAAEIGLLELQKEGFTIALHSLIQNPLPGVNLVLVTKDSLTEKLLKKFDIKNRVKEFGFPD